MTIKDRSLIQAPETLARKQVVPKGGNVRLRCAKCAGMNFEVHVTPDLTGKMAHVGEIVCLTCLNVLPIHEGLIMREGKTSMPGVGSDHIALLPSEITAKALRKRNGS